METVGVLLILTGLASGFISLIAIIRPFPRFWLPTRKRGVAVFVLSILLIGFGGSLQKNPKRGPTDQSTSAGAQEQRAIDKNEKTSAPKNAPGDREVEEESRNSDRVTPTYEIAQVDDVSLNVARRIVYRVRLGGVYPEAQAVEIAREIIEARHRDKDLVNAVRFFFYFPGSDPLSSADGAINWTPNGKWAEAYTVKVGSYDSFRFSVDFYHHERGLKVQQLLRTEPIPQHDELIGRWIQGGVTSGIITIAIRDEKAIMESKFYDGSFLTREITEKSSPIGRHFDLNNGFGEYVVVLPNGNLVFKDENGRVSSTLKKPNMRASAISD